MSDEFFFELAADATPPERIGVGAFLRCVDGSWSCGDDRLPPGTKLLALSATAVLQHWSEGKVIETEWSEAGKSLTDIRDSYNAEIPKHLWERNKDGSERPPWSLAHVVYLVDEVSAEKFTFANGTVGARIAVETLVDRVDTMRKLRGASVIPVVELTNKPMKTKHGNKLRPEFRILEWRRLGGGPVPQLEQPRPEQPKLTKVAEPTTRDEMDDEIPFSSGGESLSDRNGSLAAF
jgi:hypothetical protein